MRFLALIFLLLLTGCAQSLPDSACGVETGIMAESQDTVAAIDEPETLPETPVTTESGTSAIHTETEPLIIPDGVESDITDPACAELISELKAFADGFRDISIYYTDIDRTHYLAINADYEHEGASVLKALYCHFLLKHNVDRERLINFDEATRTSTSGELSEDAVGKDFSVDELIKLSIVYSDNMAYRLLFKTYGRYGFNDYIKSLGAETPRLPPGYEFSTVTARDLSTGMLDIYSYSLETDYQFYTDLLTESAPGGLIDSGSKYVVAHKYGYHGGYDGYHDTAIVYAEKPYILTIMTRVFPYAKDSDEVFRRTTELVEAIHEKLN